MQLCKEKKIRIIALPGACAAITALIASGLPCIRFCYEGFLPKISKKRYELLCSLSKDVRTLIFYETNHRIIESLKDMKKAFGETRYIVLAREITKKWEHIYGSQICKLIEWLKEDRNRYKGELVLLVEGYKNLNKKILDKKIIKTYFLLKKELSLKKAVYLTAKIHDIQKNLLYKFAINEEKLEV